MSLRAAVTTSKSQGAFACDHAAARMLTMSKCIAAPPEPGSWAYVAVYSFLNGALTGSSYVPITVDQTKPSANGPKRAAKFGTVGDHAVYTTGGLPWAFSALMKVWRSGSENTEI